MHGFENIPDPIQAQRAAERLRGQYIAESFRAFGKWLRNAGGGAGVAQH